MADVTVTLGAKDTGLQNSLKKAQTSVAALKPAMAGVAAAGAAAFAALAAAGVGVKKALDLGGALSDVAGQTGMTAGKVMLLQTAFDQAGLGADAVGPAINKMQKAIADAASGTGPAADALTRLGLSSEQLSSMTPDEAFKTLGTAINGIENPTARAATAMEVFGKSGGKMLTLFGDSGALATASDTLGAQAGIMEKNAAVFDRVSDLLNGSSTKLQGVFVGMAESIAPALLPIVEEFNKMDFTHLGQQLGSAAAMFIQAMTDGSIGSIMGDSIKIALGNAVNSLWAGLQGIMGALRASLSQLIPTAVTMFSIVTKPDFWKGMLDALIGAAQAFGSKLLGIIAEALSLFSKIPGLAGMLEKPMAAIKGAGDSLQTSAGSNLASGADKLAPFMDQYTKQFGENMAAMSAGFQQGFDNAGPAFDLSGVQSNLDDTFSRLGNTVESLKTQAQAALPAPNTPGGAKLPALGAFGGEAAAKQATNQPLFASSLAKIGGGGGIAGAPSALLDETRKQTQFLRQIAARIGGNSTPVLA